MVRETRGGDALLTMRVSSDLILTECAQSAVSKGGEANTQQAALIANPPNGLLLRPVPDRACQRGVAVSGGVGAVDHFWRDADREFRAWRVLHARRLRRLYADRTMVRRARLLGRHRRRGAGRRCDRRHRRDAVAPTDLSRAGAVPAARDLRPDADGGRSRRADLGAERSARPPRAGLQGCGRLLRPEHPEL